MNKKAKRELIEAISGLVMVIVGVFLFVSKARMESDFLNINGKWTWWKVTISFLPLIAGIVMMVAKPKLRVSKLIALVGVLVVAIILFIDTTIVVKAGVHPMEWIMGIVLVTLGMIVCVAALFFKRKSK